MPSDTHSSPITSPTTLFSASGHLGQLLAKSAQHKSLTHQVKQALPDRFGACIVAVDEKRTATNTQWIIHLLSPACRAIWHHQLPHLQAQLIDAFNHHIQGLSFKVSLQISRHSSPK